MEPCGREGPFLLALSVAAIVSVLLDGREACSLSRLGALLALATPSIAC
jgi:hypothetical protein